MKRDPETAAEERIISRRLYVSAGLAEGVAVPFDAAQTHYLRNVLRLTAGAELPLFNGRDGEWQARILELGKSRGSAAPLRPTRPQTAETAPWLLFAPLKHGAIDFLVEKATELGVGRLLPVRTQRTIVARIKLDRLAAHAREAAEQTERLSVPIVEELQPLDRLLQNWPADRQLILCDESGSAPPIELALRDAEIMQSNWAILVGPEGGFTIEELNTIRNLPFVTAVGLGPRVLRADTAALAALAVFQSVRGDWCDAR
jgi:16S rRNA (uracil1498-N3)-methyltransferase